MGLRSTADFLDCDTVDASAIFDFWSSKLSRNTQRRDWDSCLRQVYPAVGQLYNSLLTDNERHRVAGS